MLLYVMKGSLNTLETTLKVLLEIPKYCSTSPEVARDVQRAIKIPREKEGRRKKNIVCMYIYIASLRVEGVQEKTTTLLFFLKPPPLLGLLYMAPP